MSWPKKPAADHLETMMRCVLKSYLLFPGPLRMKNNSVLLCANIVPVISVRILLPVPHPFNPQSAIVPCHDLFKSDILYTKS